MSQKTSLQVQYTFFVHFFAALLHDYNVETLRNFLATRFMKEVWYICVPVHFFFFATADSHFGGREHFSFFHCRYKTFLRFPSNEIDLLCFLSLTLALSLLYRSIYTLKFSRKKGCIHLQRTRIAVAFPCSKFYCFWV